MNRVMGLDIGDRRVGFAFGNRMAMGSSMVVPGGFLEVRSPEDAVKQIAELAKEEEVDAMVVGLPLIQGQDNPQSKKVRALVEALKAKLPDMDLHFWDETLTSFDAQSLLVGAELKHSGKSKRGRVDAAAAALILQGFLDSRRFQPGL